MDTINHKDTIDGELRSRNIFEQINLQAMHNDLDTETPKSSENTKSLNDPIDNKSIEPNKENQEVSKTENSEDSRTVSSDYVEKILPRYATHPRDMNDDDEGDPVIKCLYNDGKYRCVNCNFEISFPTSFQYHVWKHLHVVDKTCNTCEGEDLEINPFNVVCPTVILVMQKLNTRAKKYRKKIDKQRRRILVEQKSESTESTAVDNKTVSAADPSSQAQESSQSPEVNSEDRSEDSTKSDNPVEKTDTDKNENQGEKDLPTESKKAEDKENINQSDQSKMNRQPSVSGHSPRKYRTIVPNPPAASTAASTAITSPPMSPMSIVQSSTPTFVLSTSTPFVVNQAAAGIVMPQFVNATAATVMQNGGSTILSPVPQLVPMTQQAGAAVNGDRSVWQALIPQTLQCASPPKPSTTLNSPIVAIKKEDIGTVSPGPRMNIVVQNVQSLADVKGARALFDSPSFSSPKKPTDVAKEIASAVKPIRTPTEIQASHLEKLEKSEGMFYVCGVGRCTYSTGMDVSFAGHLFTMHSFECALPCVYCQATFPTREHLVEHMKIHSEVVGDIKPYSCDECDFSSNILGDFKTHYNNTHAETERHVCKHCRETFTETDDLWQHISSNFVRIVHCAHCRVMNSNRRFVIKHISEQHPGQPRSFTGSNMMLCQERRRVANCLSDKCIACGETVSELPFMRKHLEACEQYQGMVNHTPVDCIDCTAKFKSQLDLVRHALRGHALSFLSCPAANCAFATSNPNKFHVHCLQVHKALEDTVTVYECSACNVKSNLKDFVRVHLTKVHAEDTSAKIVAVVKKHSVYKETAGYWQCSKCRVYMAKKGQRAISDHQKEHEDRKKIGELIEICPKCGDAFDCLASLYDHIGKSHTERVDVTLYACLLCVMRSTNKKATLAHSKHHRESVRSCDTLEKVMWNTTAECPVCAFTCVERDLERVMIPHIEDKHGDLAEKMKEKVRAMYGQSDDHQASEPIAPDDLKFPCHHCEFTGTVDEFREHIVTHFSGERTFTWFNCGFCHFQAKNAALVTRHCKMSHLVHANCSDKRTVTLVGTAGESVMETGPVSPPRPGTSIERYLCDHCSLGFNDDESFRKHVCPVTESMDTSAKVKDEPDSRTTVLDATQSEALDLPDLDMPILSPQAKAVDDDDDNDDVGDDHFHDETASVEKPTEKKQSTTTTTEPDAEDDLQCPHCDFKATIQRGLKRHMTVLHGKVNKQPVVNNDQNKDKKAPAYKRGEVVPVNRERLMKVLKGPASVMRQAKLAAKKTPSPQKVTPVIGTGRRTARKSMASASVPPPSEEAAQEDLTPEDVLKPFPNNFYRKKSANLYECCLCSNFTKTSRPLFMHVVQTHLGLHRFCCQKCNFEKHKIADVEEHCQEKHGDRNAYTNKDYMTTHKAELQQHIVEFSARTGRDKGYSPLKRRSNEPTRDLVVNSQQNVYKHPVASESRRSEMKKYKCKECGVQLNDGTLAETHAQKQHQRAPDDILEVITKLNISLVHKCMVCEEYQSLRQPTDVLEHYGLRHKGLTSYVCQHCNSSFDKFLELVSHTKDTHTNDQTIVEISRSNTKGEVKNPIKTGGTFKCPSCAFSKSSAFLVKEHMKTHIIKQDAVFQCFYCEFSSDKKPEICEHHTGLHGREAVAIIVDKSAAKRGIKRESSPVAGTSKRPRLEDQNQITPPRIGSPTNNDSSPAYGRRSGGEKLTCHKCPTDKTYQTTVLKDMKKHLMKHMGYQPYVCQFRGCKTKASSEHAITKHFRATHKGEPKFDTVRKDTQEKLLKKLLIRAKTVAGSSSSEDTPDRRKAEEGSKEADSDKAKTRNKVTNNNPNPNNPEKSKTTEKDGSAKKHHNSGHSSSGRSETGTSPAPSGSATTKSYMWQNSTTVTYLCLVCDYKIDGNYNLIEKHFNNKHSGRVQALAINKTNRHKYEPQFSKPDGRLTLTCRVCNFQAHQHTDFRKHWKEHLSMNWKCGYCGTYEAADKQEILYHHRTDHPGVPSNVLKIENLTAAAVEEKPEVKPTFWSKDGEKVETSKKGVTYKLKSNGEYGCTKCNFAAKKLPPVESHFIKWHKPRYMCEDCSFRVRTIEDMRRHLSSNKKHGYIEIDDITGLPLKDTERRDYAASKLREDSDHKPDPPGTTPGTSTSTQGGNTTITVTADTNTTQQEQVPESSGSNSNKYKKALESSECSKQKQVPEPRDTTKQKQMPVSRESSTTPTPKSRGRPTDEERRQTRLKLKSARRTEPSQPLKSLRKRPRTVSEESGSGDDSDVRVGPSETVKSRVRRSREPKYIDSNSEDLDDDQDEDFQPKKKKWSRAIVESDSESETERENRAKPVVRKVEVVAKVRVKTEPKENLSPIPTPAPTPAAKVVKLEPLPQIQKFEFFTNTVTMFDEGSLQYQCQYCPEKLGNELEFGLHMNRHINFNRTVTTRLGEGQDRGLDTAKHLYRENVHPYFCCKCGRSFFNLFSARNHATSAHRGPSKVSQLGFKDGKPCDEVISITFEEFAAEETYIDYHPKPMEESDPQLSADFFPSPLDGCQPNVLLADFRDLSQKRKKSILAANNIRNANYR